MAPEHYTRRAFLAGTGALCALSAAGEKSVAAARWIFLGTDTGPGIYRAAWNPRTGALGRPVLAAATTRPDFFALHPTLPVLYTVNSVAGRGAAVSAFQVDASSGALTLLNSRETHGDGPCAVSVDRSGWCVFAANYAGGSMTAFQLGANGTLTETLGVFRYSQAMHGPVADRQDAAHLHSVTVSPDNQFVVTCDLGDDVLLVFPVAASANASVQQPLRVAARAGSGPRHVAFHPNGRWLYCIHELDNTVDVYGWRVSGGQPSLTLRDSSIVSTAGTQAAGNSACELIVSDDGRFLYACTRGENTIAMFAIGPDGLLRVQQRVACGGITPRHIAFDPSRRWLLCCNMAAPGGVSVFSVDAASGRLSAQPQHFAADTPMFAAWV